MKKVMLIPSMFDEQEFTVQNKETGDILGFIVMKTNIIPNEFKAKSIYGKEGIFNTIELATLFLMASKANRSISKPKIDPMQRTMMDLL